MSNTLSHTFAPERLVDLTQPLGEHTTLWPGSTAFRATVEATHERERSYYRSLTLAEHSGTHLDAPIHFGPGGRAMHELPLESLVRPAACLDVRDRCADDPDYTLSRAEIEEFEERDGLLPQGSAALVCTGWDRFIGTPRYAGEPLSFPGLASDAAELLVERGLVGIGIDTLGVDAGHATGLPVHRITQPAGLWHLEGLVGLDSLPPRGAWLVVGALPLLDGSGAPARAFAVLP